MQDWKLFVVVHAVAGETTGYMASVKAGSGWQLDALWLASYQLLSSSKKDRVKMLGLNADRLVRAVLAWGLSCRSL